jgi:hypothetical protein
VDETPSIVCYGRVNGRHRKINAAAVWENHTLVAEIVAISATNGTSRRAMVRVEPVNP